MTKEAMYPRFLRHLLIGLLKLSSLNNLLYLFKHTYFTCINVSNTTYIHYNILQTSNSNHNTNFDNCGHEPKEYSICIL